MGYLFVRLIHLKQWAISTDDRWIFNVILFAAPACVRVLFALVIRSRCSGLGFRFSRRAFNHTHIRKELGVCVLFLLLLSSIIPATSAARLKTTRLLEPNQYATTQPRLCNSHTRSIMSIPEASHFQPSQLAGTTGQPRMLCIWQRQRQRIGLWSSRAHRIFLSHTRCQAADFARIRSIWVGFLTTVVFGA